MVYQVLKYWMRMVESNSAPLMFRRCTKIIANNIKTMDEGRKGKRMVKEMLLHVCEVLKRAILAQLGNCQTEQT